MAVLIIGSIVLTIFVVAIIIVAIIATTYNKLIKLQNKVKNSWANIDAQLQRRFDLIPNLVETIKGFMAHEKYIVDNMTANRDGYLNAHSNEEKLALNAELTSNLRQLYNMSDKYPQLKLDTNFLKLQSDLAEIEEDITYARQFYNDSVTIYNNQRMTFPSNMIASMFHMSEEKLFDAVREAETAPKVHFRTSQYMKCPNCGASVPDDAVNCEHCGCSLI